MPEKAAKQKYPHVDEMWIRVQGWDPDRDPVSKSLAPSPDPFFLKSLDQEYLPEHLDLILSP